jgi:hypothetical protein
MEYRTGDEGVRFAVGKPLKKVAHQGRNAISRRGHVDYPVAGHNTYPAMPITPCPIDQADPAWKMLAIL